MEKLWRCGEGMLKEKRKPWRGSQGFSILRTFDSFRPGGYSLGDETVLDIQAV